MAAARDAGSRVSETAERVTYRMVFAVAEFRVLWLAQLASVIGDQFARVALTVLVYERTRSPLLAAVTYAASIVPGFIGGLTLSGLADRLPRRQVMITCDLARAALVAVMVVPGVPLAALVALLFVVTLIGAPFSSARSAVYPDVLTGDAYVLGNAVTLTTYQLAQVIGFATGGAVVAVLGARSCLVADAVTFALSAVLVRLGVHARPAVAARTGWLAQPIADAVAGIRLVFGNPALRVPMLYGWIAGFYVVPEGVVAPLAASLHGGPKTVGLILAVVALGSSVGAVACGRLLPPPYRQRLMGPLAVAYGAILALFAAGPGLIAGLVILTVSGLCDAYQPAANAAFVTAAPRESRAQAFGLATAGMSLGQGLTIILAGAAAQQFAPSTVIAVSGGLGAVCGLALMMGRSQRSC